MAGAWPAFGPHVREFTHRTNRLGLLESSTILVPAFDHSTHVVMDSFQATKISRSSAVCCVLGSKESSVDRKHGQLTADDGTHSHMCLPLVDAAVATSFVVFLTLTLARGRGVQSYLVPGSLLQQHQHIPGRSLVQLGYSMPWTGHCFIPMIKSIDLLTESRQRDN
jgi:hypothetical protein